MLLGNWRVDFFLQIYIVGYGKTIWIGNITRQYWGPTGGCHLLIYNNASLSCSVVLFQPRSVTNMLVWVMQRIFIQDWRFSALDGMKIRERRLGYYKQESDWSDGPRNKNWMGRKININRGLWVAQSRGINTLMMPMESKHRCAGSSRILRPEGGVYLFMTQ